jgi:RNA 2',3'-cyclic 3'-phosphodiesterase
MLILHGVTEINTVRLFIALELPDEIKEALRTIQDQLKREVNAIGGQKAIRWSAIDGVHLTLKFLGEVKESQRPEIEAAIAEAVKGIPPFNLKINSVGGFPNLNRPRVIWIGCDGDSTMLHKLRDAVESTVAPLGFPTEERPFSPHLTLGRAVQDARSASLAAIGQKIEKLKEAMKKNGNQSESTWVASEVSLMMSDLKPSGAVYTALYSVPLK